MAKFHYILIKNVLSPPIEFYKLGIDPYTEFLGIQHQRILKYLHSAKWFTTSLNNNTSNQDYG